MVKKTFLFNYVMKTNPWTYKIKNFNREALIGTFHEKSYC